MLDIIAKYRYSYYDMFVILTSIWLADTGRWLWLVLFFVAAAFVWFYVIFPREHT